MPTQPATFVCRFCYSTNHALYPVRLYYISLNEGLIMCANQNCTGIVHGHVDLLKLILPITSSTSQLTYEQYQQTPYYSPECDFLIKIMSLLLDDEVTLGNDSRYKSYSLAIEKILKQFEHTTEWPDLITNLVKVKKTLESHSQFQSIPKRLTLSKRLAQCLHSALPSGVHLKTLEVYETIFRMVAKHNLQRDIVLYSCELFSLLPVAALPVKPVLLTIFETYFLPLGEALNPVLTGFLIGLFSALEEGADYYDRVILLLDHLSDGIDELYFYTCIWSAICLAVSVRHSAISYILNHFDKRKNMEDQMYLIGLSIETMVSAVCVCLHDNGQSLVQRSILDFILICLPMHKNKLTKVDLIEIITMTFHILLKHDMGLNRRIYAWFLGTNESCKDINEQQQSNDIFDSVFYFSKYTQEILIESLRNALETTSIKAIFKSDDSENKVVVEMTKTQPSPWTLTQLIRVLIVLVEQSDVGPSLIEYVFMNYLLLTYEQVYHPVKTLTSTNIQQENTYLETLKTFNMLLDTLEPYFIWEYLTKIFDIILNQQHDQYSITAGCTIEQICEIITMLLDIFSSKSSTDIQSEHLSEMLSHLINTANINIEKLTSNQITLCVQMLLKILKNIMQTDTYHHLSAIQSPMNDSYQKLDHHHHHQLVDSDTDDDDKEVEEVIFVDNEYSTDIYHKLLRTDSIGKIQNPNVIVEQEDSIVIERLLRQIVRKVEKEIYKLNTPQFDEQRTRLSTKTIVESINHLEHSIVLFQLFFHRFIQTYLFDKNQLSINEKFQSIYSILQNKTSDDLSIIFHRYQDLNEFQLKLNENVNQYQTVFEHCCKLLIEFCSWPKQTFINDQSVLSRGKTDFDDWLIDLYVLSLCHNDNFSFRTIAISTLIELFAYTINSTTSNRKISTQPSLLSSLTIEQVSLFLNETDFFQYITGYLWEYLSDQYNREYNLKAALILSNLHSILPSNLCDDLICNQLSFDNIEQFENEVKIIDKVKRFFKLWNSTRSTSNKTNEHLTKPFQCCLVYILSILKESDSHCLKSMVQQWTYDCFVHGDMCRIFDILFLMLLHSDTARINIQRCDSLVQKDFRLEQEINEIDHLLINSSLNQDTNEITFSITFDNEDDEDAFDYETEQEEIDEKRIRTTSCRNPSESIYQIKSSPQPIRFSSFLNFSQPILSNIRSLSPPILRKSTKSRAPTVSTLSIQTNTSSPNINHSFRAHSVPIDSITNESISSSTNDLIDNYILLYTQPYDYKRVKLALTIIENLIDIIPEQLIHNLLTTSNIQSSPISLHNHQMHELFLKHRRSIDGNDFNLSTENLQEYQSYLYLLLNILLIYTCSYHSKSIHLQENHKIHIYCLLILTRICHNLSSICINNIVVINYVVNLLKKVSFQKILLCLFNGMMNRKSFDYNTKEYLHEQLTKQYLKQLVQSIEEMVLLENIIISTDLKLINQPMVNQNIFLTTILSYLKQIDLIENHRYIISLVVRILPHCGSALNVISTRVIEQICRNVCFVVQYYGQEEGKIKFKNSSTFDAFDYIIHLIQRLSYICNYCLGNSTYNGQQFTQILCPQHWSKRLTINANDLSDARQSILNKFPLILSSLLFIWKTISIDETKSLWLDTNIKHIRDTIVEFITSLTNANSISFLRAVAQCWGEYKQQQKCSTDTTGDIQALFKIFMSINNFTINDMIYNINELVRNPSTTNDKKKQNYIVWCLQFLLAYLEQLKDVSIDYWSLLAALFKECLAQSTLPSVTYFIIRILSFYIKQSPSFVEKQDLKDLQDITMKVFENCNVIVASSLEQTKWLRKNLQVRLAQSDLETPITIDSSIETDNDDPTLYFEDTSQPTNSSLLALTILAEHAAKLLDIVYTLTDEKDRVVVPYLQNLVMNVMPYVRTHIASNAPSYRSASSLLMSISQYSYTRRAWKKEVFEHLFDPGFFQVDMLTLRSWKVIIDNMISNGKTTSFRDVINRINTVQTGLFVSKEQEYEQRAMLIKRFAFVIYSSEKDQYNRYLPEILECITDLFKLPQVPILHTQLFLFFRVLLLRMSSKNLISFWPIIMSELIQVLLQLEQDLVSDIDGDIKSHIQRMTTNDITSVTISNTNQTLKLYLYACKLLDLLLAIPHADLYNFQFFRSAFVVDHNLSNQNSTNNTFVTFSIRLSKLFEQKLQSISTSIPVIKLSNCPLLRSRTICNILELFSFFDYLSKMYFYDNLLLKNEQMSASDKTNDIETSVLEDFIEFWI